MAASHPFSAFSAFSAALGVLGVLSVLSVLRIEMSVGGRDPGRKGSNHDR
jgi:hypothetical protein